MRTFARFFIGCLTLLAYCGAAPLNWPSFLTRQQEAPYPAAGFKPNIPFELPTEVQTVPATEVEFTTTVQPTKVEVPFSQSPEVVYLPAVSDVSTPASTYGPPIVTAREKPATSTDAAIEDTVPIAAADAKDVAPIAPKSLPAAAAVEHDENEDIIPDAFRPQKQNLRLRRPLARIAPPSTAAQPAAIELLQNEIPFNPLPQSAALRFGTRLKPRRKQKLI